MKYFTDLDIYGHISLNLSIDIPLDGSISNVSTENVSFLRFLKPAPIVHGFANGNDNNKILVVTYIGIGNLTLKDKSTICAIENQISTGYDEDLIIYSGQNVILIYDSESNIWRIISVPKSVKKITTLNNQLTINSQNNGDVQILLPQDIFTDSSVTFANLNLINNTTTAKIVSSDDLIIQATGDLFLKNLNSSGSVIIDNNILSSDKITGALIITGGVGVSGDIYADKLYENTNRVLTQSSSIDDLLDVDLSNKQSNFVIGYNSTNQKWEAMSVSAVSSTDTLADITGRGAITDKIITLSNVTDALDNNSGALIISGGLSVKKRINTKNLTINSIKSRIGVSSPLTSGIIDLSMDDYQIYQIDQTDHFYADISFDNGTPGEIFYVKIKSDGNRYTWDITNNQVKWPSNIVPVPSTVNKTDLYHFICLSSTEYLGTYVFNYT